MLFYTNNIILHPCNETKYVNIRISLNKPSIILVAEIIKILMLKNNLITTFNIECLLY